MRSTYLLVKIYNHPLYIFCICNFRVEDCYMYCRKYIRNICRWITTYWLNINGATLTLAKNGLSIWQTTNMFFSCFILNFLLSQTSLSLSLSPLSNISLSPTFSPLKHLALLSIYHSNLNWVMNFYLSWINDVQLVYISCKLKLNSTHAYIKIVKFIFQ